MRLETARLTVRPFTEEDLPYASYLADPVTMAYVQKPMDAGEAIAFLRKYALVEHPAVWALEYRETGLLLGHVIFHPFDGRGAWEIGWVLDSRVRGHGLAPESGRALIVHAFSRGDVTRLVAETAPENAAARAVVRKLGMTPCGEENGLLQFELKNTFGCSCKGE